jgi:hypothetical protein
VSVTSRVRGRGLLSSAITVTSHLTACYYNSTDRQTTHHPTHLLRKYLLNISDFSVNMGGTEGTQETAVGCMTVGRGPHRHCGSKLLNSCQLFALTELTL